MRDPTPAPAPLAPGAASVDALDAAALRNRVQNAVAGSYSLEGEIGRGGMAVVYAARDLRLRRTVALKVLPPDLAFRADVRMRFVREAQTAAGLNHPNIVPIYAVDERDGMVFFAMSLINGETLATRLIREPRPPVPFVESVLIQVADALAYAHSSGVVHRDIKPDNVLIDSETGRATVTDFGIARALEGGSRLTLTGIAVGTPAFMSPEQATGEREIDGRSDVYALGIMGYLMLAGRLPFDATSTPAMLVKHVSERPHPLRDYRPDAPPALAAIIERCLAKSPDDRWTAAGLRDAIKAASAGAFSGTRASSTVNPPPASVRATPRALPPQQHMPAPRTMLPPESVPRSVRPPAAEPSAAARGAAERAAAQRAAGEPPTARSDEEWRRQYALGKRAEDWTPPRLSMPMSTPPAGSSRREFREWREEVREQKSLAKQQWRADRNTLARDRGVSPDDAQMLMTPPHKLIHRFRGEVLRVTVLLAGLAAINAATTNFPWVVFPAFGMSMGLLTRYSKLREHGITLGEILSGQSEGELATREDPNTQGGRIARAARKFRSHVKWGFGLGAVSAASFAIGATLRADPMIVPFAVAGGLSLMNFVRAFTFDRVRLRKLGVTTGDAWDGSWKPAAPPADARPRQEVLHEQAMKLVGASVLASSLGRTVQAAVEDHATIRETSAQLSDADKVMVPDVEPTADALLERLAAIAGSLERLERDMPDDAMHGLEERIAAVSAEAEHAPDRDRRLSLLTRQRASLEDLVQRKETMMRQFESASMALRSLRLDMVKLRALGMGSLGDVTNATQEARALSSDIARALYAADEVRKL